MTRLVKKMPTPLGIGAGQTASVNMPLGLTYERLYIRCNADIAATPTDLTAADWASVIGEIRVMVNGDARITIDAADLVKLNSFYGEAPKAGVLPIFFSRPWMRTIGGEDASGYGTVGMATFTLEMDIKDGATVNSLTVTAVQSPATPWGPHLRIQKFNRNQGVTGSAEIADIPRGAYAMLAMHVATDQIGDVEVQTDQRNVITMDKAVRATHYDLAGRVPQAGFTHIDFTPENRLSEALSMSLQDFRLKLDFQATGNFAIYAESLMAPPAS
ncbi:major capsid protein P2 [Thioclava nitratireducens]|uniref:major capsid protein P2 n=1 Tax=Thioclava nitratireducens TaxID=1915078 RepID=UPI00248096CD|nr:major capsid protein P2 [Thioclava nitratireducens]WGT50155.1 major capsid protein P2 [Thioclava nitratireducens]